MLANLRAGCVRVPVGDPYDRPMLRSSDAAELADRFGLGDHAVLAGPVSRGFMGGIWRLTTSQGIWAVKEPDSRREEAAVAAATALEEAVAAAGVFVPGLRRADDGCVFADIGSAQVRVHEWVDLLEPDLTIDPSAVGRTVALIHGVGVPGEEPVDPWWSEIVGAEAWDMLFDELARAGAPFTDALRAQRDEIVALEALVRPPRHLQLCHGDLFADNVRQTTDGRLCVIDWEDSGMADPGYELAVVMFEYARHVPERARTLYGSYLAAGGPGRLTEPADFSMAITQINHIGEVGCRRWLSSEPGSDARSRNEGRVMEFVGEPLTRRLIDDLLAAIRR